MGCRTNSGRCHLCRLGRPRGWRGRSAPAADAVRNRWSRSPGQRCRPPVARPAGGIARPSRGEPLAPVHTPCSPCFIRSRSGTANSTAIVAASTGVITPPASAEVTAFIAAAIVVLLQQPTRRPRGSSEAPFSNGRPRIRPAVWVHAHQSSSSPWSNERVISKPPLSRECVLRIRQFNDRRHRNKAITLRTSVAPRDGGRLVSVPAVFFLQCMEALGVQNIHLKRRLKRPLRVSL
jgi:hypothetical protein